MTAGPRVMIFAASDVGYHCLRYLVERDEDIVACYTYSDPAPESDWPPSVAELCRRSNIPVRLDADWKNPLEVERVRAISPALLLSFYYRELLPEAVLALPKLGAFNMHGALLPKFRGRAPVNWAVLEGETETGATLHYMTATADAGDIVDQERVAIGPEDTAFEVQQRVAQAAVKVLARQWENLKAGAAPRHPQDLARGFYRGRRRPEDGQIDWSKTARQVHDLVRAVSHPYPGAFTDIFTGKTFIWKTRLPGLAIHDAYPGQIRVNEEGRLLVCCGDDHFVEILRLQKEGEPEISGAEWIAGRRKGTL